MNPAKTKGLRTNGYRHGYYGTVEELDNPAGFSDFRHGLPLNWSYRASLGMISGLDTL